VFIKNWILYYISANVDDLNIIGNTQDIDKPHNHLKMEFEIKDLGQRKIRLLA